jgi:ribosome-associated protein
MPRSDETPRQQGRVAIARSAVGTAPRDASRLDSTPLSKTRRKHAMRALQDLGETLVSLGPARLDALALPQKLAEAIAEARRLTQREARRRQLQFIGRLMREVDPAPIEAQLARWREPGNAEKARVAAAERWREQLLSNAGALDELCAQWPNAERAKLAALVARATEEHAHGSPPHAYRALFRALNTLLSRDNS